MPARGRDFLAQSELGALGQRGARRSDSVIYRGADAAGRLSHRLHAGGNGLRSARGASENMYPNAAAGGGTNGRRSPQLTASQASVYGRPLVAVPAPRYSEGSALMDVTNVRSNAADTVKPDKPQQPKPDQQEPEAQAGDPQSAEEYVADINGQLFREETVLLPRPDYMDAQTDINGKMRSILVDWLIEVHLKYRLRSETLHLAVNLIDRYLGRTSVMRKRLQLVGVVAMFIASKFEEISPPELRDWVYMTDKAYTQEEVLVMECSMLTTLSFQIMVPTAAHFFPGLQKANGCNNVHRELAQYILELGLLDMGTLQYSPSHVVSAALLLSNELLGRRPAWPPGMAQDSRHAEASLRDCTEALRKQLDANRGGAGGQLQALYKKYSSAQRHSVAALRF